MARRPIKRDEANRMRSLLGVDDDRVFGIPQVVPIDSAEDMTIIGEDSPIWKTKKLGGRATFVTLVPPPDTSDQVIDELKRRLYADHGARVIHVRPKTKSLTVIAQDVNNEHFSADVRAVVLAMIEEANSSNKDALRARLEESLASVGL